MVAFAFWHWFLNYPLDFPSTKKRQILSVRIEKGGIFPREKACFYLNKRNEQGRNAKFVGNVENYTGKMWVDCTDWNWKKAVDYAKLLFKFLKACILCWLKCVKIFLYVLSLFYLAQHPPCISYLHINSKLMCQPYLLILFIFPSSN